MPIETRCTACNALFRLPDAMAGNKVRCQRCGEVFIVPATTFARPADTEESAPVLFQQKTLPPPPMSLPEPEAATAENGAEAASAEAASTNPEESASPAANLPAATRPAEPDLESDVEIPSANNEVESASLPAASSWDVGNDSADPAGRRSTQSSETATNLEESGNRRENDGTDRATDTTDRRSDDPVGGDWEDDEDRYPRRDRDEPRRRRRSAGGRPGRRREKRGRTDRKPRARQRSGGVYWVLGALGWAICVGLAAIVVGVNSYDTRPIPRPMPPRPARGWPAQPRIQEKIAVAEKAPGRDGEFVRMAFRGTTVVKGTIKADDPPDLAAPRGPSKWYRISLHRGGVYFFELDSDNVDRFRIQHMQFAALERRNDDNAQDQDIKDPKNGPNRPARTMRYLCARSGIYHLVISGSDKEHVGDFTIKIREVHVDSEQWQVVLDIRDTLKFNDPNDRVRRGCTCNVHNFNMNSDSCYRIDMEAAFDAYLRIETPQMLQVASDDDGGEGLNSRIMFTPSKTDNYRVITTSFSRASGAYRLVIRRLSPDVIDNPFEKEAEKIAPPKADKKLDPLHEPDKKKEPDKLDEDFKEKFDGKIPDAKQDEPKQPAPKRKPAPERQDPNKISGADTTRNRAFVRRYDLEQSLCRDESDRHRWPRKHIA